MKSLLYKDLVNLRQQLKIYLMIVVLWVAVTVMENNPSFLGGVLSVLGVLISITAYSYDEKAGWDKYALTMPVGKREMVLSKYVLAFLALMCGMLVFLGANVALHTPGREVFNLGCMFIAVGLLATDVILPIIFRFGVEKGRMIVMLSFLMPCIICLVGNNVFGGDLDRFLSSDLFPFLPVALGILLFPVSAAVSCGIYQKREF